MNTKTAVERLRLLANTIEELEIDNIIDCDIEKPSCHLIKLKLTNADPIWKERHCLPYPWEKSFTYNNIRFYALYSQEEYDKEKSV